MMGFLVAFYREPTAEEQAALQEEQKELERIDALRAGEHLVSGYFNMTSGLGRALQSLVDDGLMYCRCWSAANGGQYRYRLTRAGQEYLREWLAS